MTLKAVTTHRAFEIKLVCGAVDFGYALTLAELIKKTHESLYIVLVLQINPITQSSTQAKKAEMTWSYRFPNNLYKQKRMISANMYEFQCSSWSYFSGRMML